MAYKNRTGEPKRLRLFLYLYCFMCADLITFLRYQTAKLDSFDVDKVRIAAFAVWRSAGDDDDIAFLYQSALFR